MTLAAHSFEVQFEHAWPARSWRDCHVLLAVSGGADSVAMLRAAMSVKHAAGGTGRLFVGHLNHRVRGAESDSDQKWVEDLGRELSVPLEVGAVDVAALAAERGNGLEAAAREARYDFLLQTAQRLGARYVVTAHTADDQMETVLHHILRGTGLAGLAGMRAVRLLSPAVTLVRPLLMATRREVLAYLEEIGQTYRVDSTNSDPRWTRNKLRRELLPLLRDQYNANVDASLARLAAQAGEAQQVLGSIAVDIVERCATIESAAERKDGRDAKWVRIDCRELAGQPPIVVREVCKSAWRAAAWPLQSMGFDQWQQLASIVCGELDPGGTNFPASVRARRENHGVVLERTGPA